jgi:predicted RNA binding protein YcfA (HicA-like mRNA interferase family)
MPSRKAAKLLERARNSRAGWRAHDLEALYLAFGFEVVAGAGKGSHRILRHPKYKQLRATISDHASELSPAYVTTALQLIDQLLELEKGDRPDEQ